MPKKILLVDDEKETIGLLKKKIQGAGYEVYVAFNGKEGLETAERVHPHLVLTDMNMPVMDGMEFYRQLKARADLAHIPVIVATAYGNLEDELRHKGVKDLLIKPFDASTLLNKINFFFQSQKALKILIATKMFYLTRLMMKDIAVDTAGLDIHLTNDPNTIVYEALRLGPDLIMMDINMFLHPPANEVVSLLRQQRALKETIILITQNMLGDSDNLTVMKCLAHGASHFVGPLNESTFLSIVDDYCLRNNSKNAPVT